MTDHEKCPNGFHLLQSEWLQILLGQSTKGGGGGHGSLWEDDSEYLSNLNPVGFFVACSTNCNVNFNSYLYCVSVCFGSKFKIKNGTYAAIFHCNVTSCVFSIVVLNLDKAG